ncbi:MAG: tRNA preQ1(34) S-adenosylmethionine ribosyltransferase-isomerase QueA [Patescibacteria group bacterium]
MNIQDYDYVLPPELIAQVPESPRDASRLFVYDTVRDQIIFDQFRNVDKYLPSDSFLVLNSTKVVPARLMVKKETGGKAELLLLVNEWRAGDSFIKTLSDRKLTVGQKIFIHKQLGFQIAGQDEKVFLLKPNFPWKDLHKILMQYGTTPIPKYIRHSPLKEAQLRQKYQTVFARKAGSTAAPTASLHFTKSVFTKLAKKGIPHLFVTLHVGLGTFSPVTEENFSKKKLWNEYFDIAKTSARNIRSFKKSGKKLIAVGTTAVRTLESAAKGKEHATDLFIFPPYSFKAVDGLITNFHIPKSSLMMLVDAFLQHKKAKRNIRELYQVAIQNQFRFYSFGDAMLIL